MGAILSIDSVVSSLRSSIPDAEWFLRHIESEQGWVRFPPSLANAITNLKIENYPLLYASESAIGIMLFKAFLPDDIIKELGVEFESATPEERGKFITEFTSTLFDEIDKIEIPKTPKAREEAKRKFLELPEEEKKEAIRACQHFLSFFLASFYQNLSVMVHGEKLTSLAAQAVAGNDEAFAKAIQIDRRILTEYPYFRERFVRAQMEGDCDFYDLISYRVNSAPYRGKIRYNSLWLTFSVLDASGLLDELKHREILDICDELGVGGMENRIQDVKYLSKRISEYREFQKRGLVLTH
jgi:hypothetical protein